MTPTRRRFLGGLAAASAATALPFGRVLHAASGNDLRFVFVFNDGGWDPTHVFAPLFDNPNVDMEATAGTEIYDQIPIVASAERPSVSEFFSRHSSRSVVFNGMKVHSISHQVCNRQVLTGGNNRMASDWGALLAHAQQGSFTLPHLVLGGPAFPGSLGSAVARTGANGQLDGLISGTLLDESDDFAGRPRPPAERILDDFVQRRARAELDAASGDIERGLISGFDSSLQRSRGLKDVQLDMNFVPGDSMRTQAITAVDALRLGISRCVSISSAGSWDTHQNIQEQSTLFEGLFDGLLSLLELLETTPGRVEPTLADETVVVVLSEMGRTPRLNVSQGRDHWEDTSALLVGPGLDGGRVVGGLDNYYYGLGVDPGTGEASPSAPEFDSGVLGATLLALADIDPGEALPGVTPITGALRS